MNKTYVYIVAIIVAVAALYVFTASGTDGIDVPFGDENVAGVATFHISAIQPNGDLIDITTSRWDPFSFVMYEGYIINGFSSFACVKATDLTGGQLPYVKVDMGNINIVYKIKLTETSPAEKTDTHSLSGVTTPFLTDGGVHTGQCSGGDTYDVGAVIDGLGSITGDFILEITISGNFEWAGCTEAGVLETAWTTNIVPADTYIIIPLSVDLSGAIAFDWDITHTEF